MELGTNYNMNVAASNSLCRIICTLGGVHNQFYIQLASRNIEISIK